MTESINQNPDATPLPSPVQDIVVPDGYVETPLWDPFEAFLGPIFDKQTPSKEGATELWMAFRADARHINAGGVVHGGMLMTFADACLGSVAWNANNRAPCVTVSMQTNFMAPARLGDLVEARAQMRRETRSVLFVGGEFFVDGKLIMTAQSVWKVLGR